MGHLVPEFFFPIPELCTVVANFQNPTIDHVIPMYLGQLIISIPDITHQPPTANRPTRSRPRELSTNTRELRDFCSGAQCLAGAGPWGQTRRNRPLTRAPEMVKKFQSFKPRKYFKVSNLENISHYRPGKSDSGL